MNPAPDYSAAYVILETDDPGLTGHGFTFTIGRGNEVCVAAIEAFRQAMRLSPLDRLGHLCTGGIATAHLVAGRYEEAADWTERTLREAPGHTIFLLGKAVACAHLDRIEEARVVVSQLREVQPWLTIAWFKASATRYPPEIRARYVDGLRKAGMPEE